MKRVLSLAALLAAASLALAIPRATSAPPRPAGGTALARSDALAAAPAANRFGVADVPAAAVRGFADGLADDVPLPRGGTFDGIQWEAAGGAFSTAETRAILQYNAMCQWVRAHRDGRETDVSARILAELPGWAAWRGTETATMLGAAIAELLAGGGPAAAALLAECDAAHEREVRYADARGGRASR